MKDFEGAPLFVDATAGRRGVVFVGTDIDDDLICGINSYDRQGWRWISELKPINADARAFLAIARAGAK